MGERRREDAGGGERDTDKEAPAQQEVPEEDMEIPEEERRGRHNPEDFSPDDFE